MRGSVVDAVLGRPLSEPALASLAQRLDVRSQAQQVLQRLRSTAARPPCVVLLGESNAGKTTIANKLVGDGLLPTSVIANTRFPMLVRNGPAVRVYAVTATSRRIRLESEDEIRGETISLLEIELPSQILKGLEIFDTPSRFAVPDLADLPGLAPLRIPIWCTSATQAWKESERKAWMAIDRVHRRHGILVITRFDRVVDEDQRRKLMHRLRDEAAPFFREIICSPDQNSGLPPLEATVRRYASKLHERRLRTVERLTARIIELSNSAFAPQQASKLAVLGFKRAQER